MPPSSMNDLFAFLSQLMTEHASLFETMGTNMFRGFAVILIAWFGITLFDVYECAINPDLLEEKIQEGDRAFETQSLLVGIDDFLADRGLESYPFERDPQLGRMKAPFTENSRPISTNDQWSMKSRPNPVRRLPPPGRRTGKSASSLRPLNVGFTKTGNGSIPG